MNKKKNQTNGQQEIGYKQIANEIKLSRDSIKMKILTHTDFVVFNKLDKMPV